MLNRRGKSEHPYFVPDLRENVFQFFIIVYDMSCEVFFSHRILFQVEEASLYSFVCCMLLVQECGVLANGSGVY